nr:sirohydrochlorin cobaltochelatase [uncultured Dysosmobacter sp.]
MLATLLAGCGKSQPDEPEDDENYETGDASLDNPRNQDEIGENELLVVSFGTSFNDSRRLTVGAIEEAMEKAFPDYSVRRGFTSQIIIDHVKERDGEVIDNVGEALDRAVDNGVKNLVIQPTHLMDGLEYNDLVNEVAQYADAFESISIGKPLLTSDEDFQTVAKAMVDATASYDDGKTAICFMGHGTEAESNAVYAKMQQVLTDGGYANYYVGTVEAAPSLDDVLALVQAGTYERVVLQPMMIVAGDHANNDMAGDEEDSWKTAFEAAGYQVECVVRGLGEFEAIQNLLVEHAQAAMDEDYTTGDASLDNPRNQDDIGESELLVVSFGTSFNDSRRLTVGAIEEAMEKAFPDYSVRRGFTSQIIIDHVKERDGEVIDNVGEALDRAVDNGVKNLVIQPTHLMDGLEYNDLVNEVAQYADAFESISIGKPLLTSDEDFQTVAKAMVDATASYDDGKTAICFMGHGTEAESNAVYAKMQQVLTDGGYANYYVGTVEAAPSLDDVLALVQAGTYERVVLQPMMIVAGDHANNDMAGDEEDSWKTAFEAAGYQVECVVRGLGEFEAIQNLLVEHAQAAAGELG